MGNSASTEKEKETASDETSADSGAVVGGRSLSESASSSSSSPLARLQQQQQIQQSRSARSRRTPSSLSEILYGQQQQHQSLHPLQYSNSSKSSSSSVTPQAPAAAAGGAPTRPAAATTTPLQIALRPSGSVALAPVLSKHNSSSSASTMGQGQSRHSSGGGSPHSTTPARPVAVPDSQADSAKKQQQQQQQQSKTQRDERLLPIIPIGPPITTEPNSYLLPDSEFARPPRLPLPIGGENVPIEGSPILSPVEAGLDAVAAEPLELVDGHFPLVSRASELSNTTVDDDDIGDDLGTVRGGVLPPVPTLIEWFEPGNRVYVTGTFADWDRKYRLMKNGPSKHKDALSTVINLQPGTYHLRFIVDGDMILSKHLPYAVDFTNSLVNYIEVIPKETTAIAGPQSLMPAELQTQVSTHQVLDFQPPVPEYPKEPATHPAPGTSTPVLPPTPAIGPVAATSPVPPASETPSQHTDVRHTVTTAAAPPVRYTMNIPPWLKDSDAIDNTDEFQRSMALQESLPGPPTLPMFLNKSILNGNMPMKDDASVLILPNHTVLNHLATTSIKNNVLATSATTRYKRKFLTTIMYKPTDARD